MTVEIAPPLKTYTVKGNPFTLDKVDLPEAHIVNGRGFPVAYEVNTHSEKFDKSKVEELLLNFSQDGTFTKLIEDHGAVVLRDTIENSDESKSAEIAEIIRLVEENRGLEVFQQNGTRVVRNKKGYNLFSANEYAPPEATLLQHNEYSRFKKWPATIDFSIAEYTATGGETTLVHGGELYQRVAKELPHFLEKITEVGLKFNEEVWTKEPVEKTDIVWDHEVTFGREIKPGDDLATKKKKAEQIAKQFISDDFRWDENDNLVVTSTTKPVKSFKGEPLLFSSIPAYVDIYQNSESPKIRYGNGDLFPKEELNTFKDISIDLEYKHNWKSGDIVFVHNIQVSHGKLPFKDGKRKILVGMWDEKVPSNSILEFKDLKI